MCLTTYSLEELYTSAFKTFITLAHVVLNLGIFCETCRNMLPVTGRSVMHSTESLLQLQVLPPYFVSTRWGEGGSDFVFEGTFSQIFA
jgi:hypothetical protein